MADPIDAVLVGAGNRGHFVYGAYALLHPDEVRFVAVAEPDEGRRLRFADAHAIPPERQYASWEEMARQPRLAPAARERDDGRRPPPAASRCSRPATT